MTVELFYRYVRYALSVSCAQSWNITYLPASETFVILYNYLTPFENGSRRVNIFKRGWMYNPRVLVRGLI